MFFLNEVKCECGHVNPYGTVICESCGKPLVEVEGEEKLLDMRYEGVARRSQTYKRTIVDKIWNFFSSVKVGIWIIVITLLASSLGTILPQEMYIPKNVTPAEHYASEYGVFGTIYYQLGFHNLYGSWWYMLLIASLGVSLVICSLDRIVPLHRALKTQRVTRHENFLKRQRIFSKSNVDNVDEAFAVVKKQLEEKKYKVSVEDGNIAAEKGRFSRWGPYVNHIGLIIFLIGCMLRYFPGMYVDNFVWVREGETTVIPGTEEKYYIKNEKFLVETYDENEKEVYKKAIERSGGSIIKTYQTSAVLYENKSKNIVGEEPELVEIARHEIRVNDPLKHEGLALYQMDYRLNELNVMSFNLQNKATGETFGSLDIDLYNPKEVYDLGNGYKVNIKGYFADLIFDEKGEPGTKGKIPNNPAFIFEMITPEHPEGEISFVAIKQNLEPFGDNDYKMAFSNIETKDVTGLTVRKDRTLPFLIVGGAIFMIGLIQGSYWVHRRVWLQRMNGEVWVAGHTNKNWTSLKKEIDEVLANTKINKPVDQVEERENQTLEELKEEAEDDSIK